MAREHPRRSAGYPKTIRVYQTRDYTPDIHAAAFALPRFILDAVEEGRAKA